jgi:hypothetical protein
LQNHGDAMPIVAHTCSEQVDLTPNAAPDDLGNLSV